MMKTDNTKPLGIYIHVPFCASKCGYCGFYSKKGCLDDYGEYTEKMIKSISKFEMRSRRFLSDQFSPDNYQVNTVFFGGGTPSILPYEEIEKILEALRKTFHFSNVEDLEISIEANPGTIRIEKLSAYKAMGINRISLGVQSFNDEELKVIGRIHDSKTAKESFYLCERAGFDNINLDMIFSLPGQSFVSWQNNLSEVDILSPKHLSVYGLQLEEGTDFFENFEEGVFNETPEELDREMYHYTEDFLQGKGYNHYEISNWARPGFECKHNLKYWNLSEYLSFGPSSASFVDGTRFSVSTSYYGDNGTWKFEDVHKNSFFDSASEYAFTALRRKKGIDFNEFFELFGATFWSVFKVLRDELNEYEKKGLIKISDDGISLTKNGIDVSNMVMALFV